jgi:predicted lipid-binding transport protein (Tim44 family)
MIKFLIITCIVAFLVSKLISIIGKTGGAQFVSNSLGKINIVKDVTNSVAKAPIIDHKLIFAEHKEEVLSGLADIIVKVENFSLSSFVKSAKEAMQAVATAVVSLNDATLRELTDPGFISTCKSLAPVLKEISRESYDKAEVSEAYMFSNKAFITMLTQSPEYKWTFSRHTKQSDPKWYLSNITPTSNS